MLRWIDLNNKVTLLSILGNILLATALIAMVMEANKEPDPWAEGRVTYCAATPTATIPKCPPDERMYATGIWADGTVASVSWNGSEWRMDFPGSKRQIVPPPHDWMER